VERWEKGEKRRRKFGNGKQEVRREERRHESFGGRIKAVGGASYEGASFILFSKKISTFVLQFTGHLFICKILQMSKAPGTERCPNLIPS
jgi:hypothetical protein